jgi:hypothetical protein
MLLHKLEHTAAQNAGAIGQKAAGCNSLAQRSVQTPSDLAARR